MKIKQSIFREIRCMRWSHIIICAVSSLLLGMLTGVFGSGGIAYRCLCLPRGALSASAFIIIWSIWYLLVGVAFGCVLNNCFCCSSQYLRLGIFWFSLFMLSNLLWYPIFFGLGSIVFAFLILVLHLLITLVTINSFIKIGMFPTLILCLYFVWLIYCLFINFCIILIN